MRTWSSRYITRRWRINVAMLTGRRIINHNHDPTLSAIACQVHLIHKHTWQSGNETAQFKLCKRRGAENCVGVCKFSTHDDVINVNKTDYRKYRTVFSKSFSRGAA
jgi:hypothetical protein